MFIELLDHPDVARVSREVGPAGANRTVGPNLLQATEDKHKGTGDGLGLLSFMHTRL